MKPPFDFSTWLTFYGVLILVGIAFTDLVKKFVKEDRMLVRITKRSMKQRVLILLAIMGLTVFLDVISQSLNIGIEALVVVPLWFYLSFFQGLGFFWYLGYLATAESFCVFVEGMLHQLIEGWDPISWWQGMITSAPGFPGFFYQVMNWGEFQAVVGGVAISMGILLPLEMFLSWKYEPPGSK